MSYSFHVSAAI